MEPKIGRVLLIINRSSGTGSDAGLIARLQEQLQEWAAADIAARTEAVDGHPAVKEFTGEFLSSSDVPALVIAGGGGGTLRAVVEALCDGSSGGGLPGGDRVRLASLRLGSGNLFAKLLGVPKDAGAGLRGILVNAKSESGIPCCIMRIGVGNEGGGTDVHYAATMCGFGQFGRAPGDVARWRKNHARFQSFWSGVLGIERLNFLEYSTAILLRSASVALRPSRAEEIEVRIGEEVRAFRLLAGTVLNFPIDELPFRPPVRADETVLSMHLASMTGRWAAAGLVLRRRQCARTAFQALIGEGERVEIRLRDRGSTEFFLDEDSMVFHGHLWVEPAGTLEFIPGPEFRGLQGGGTGS